MTYRRIALLQLRPGVSPADQTVLEQELHDVLDRVPGLRHAHLGRHLDGTVGGGDYTWDLMFVDREACVPWPEQLRVADHVQVFDRTVARADVVQFAPQLGEVSQPDLKDFVKRTLFLEVDRQTPAVEAARFDRVLTGMPRYISAIRNWKYSRVDDAATVGPRRWTHVWEQEFAQLSGLKLDYMMSPYHWGYVDGWFDAESPHRVVEPGVAHVYCLATTSILAWT
jgi:hypothetical protein